mgnify:CR=1 FL=1|tara:strand:- start:131 stop:622 length:492 start_codon:yes stop_codon:yes gene_type:complete
MAIKEIYQKANLILQKKESVDIDEHFKELNIYVVKSEITTILNYWDRVLNLYEEMIIEINENSNNLDIARLKQKLLEISIYGGESIKGFLSSLDMLFHKREFEKGLNKPIVAEFIQICMNLIRDKIEVRITKDANIPWDEKSLKFTNLDFIISEVMAKLDEYK